MIIFLSRKLLRLIPAIGIALLPHGPAFAASSFVLPDPSDFTLFALGVAGLLIGRHVARKRPEDSRDD